MAVYLGIFNKMLKETDDLLIKEGRNKVFVYSMRLILLDRKGDYLLVRYGVGNWLGLPGGKSTRREAINGNNLLSIGAYPTLERELFEETGIAFSLDPERTWCIGLVDGVIAEKRTGNKICRYESTVFLAKIPTLPVTSYPDVVVANIFRHHPGPLFPDARLGIERVRELIGGVKYEGPDWLSAVVDGEERKVKFQISPSPAYLF